MRDLFSKLVVIIIPLILGGLIGLFTQAWRDKQQVQTRYLDQSVSISDVIGHRSIPGRKLEILLDNKPIENLSQVSISLFNATDQPYDDIRAYVDIKPVEGDSLEVISQDVAGANGLREAVTRESNVITPGRAGSIHLGYTIKTANPLGSEPIFIAKYIVLGRERPALASLTIDKKGLDTRQLDFANFQKTSWYESSLFFVLALITAYAVGLYVMLKYARRAGVKQREKYEAYLQEKLPPKIKELGDNPDPSEIAKACSRIAERYRWENAPAWLRRFIGLKQPE